MLRNHKASIAFLLFLCSTSTLVSGRSAQQGQMPRRPDPKVQVLNNYRQYPERYIRVVEQSWKLDESTKTAFHSFTLRNSAAAVYEQIEIRITYLDSAGKALHTRLVKLPDTLAPYEVRKLKNFKMKNVPSASDQVLLVVAKALIRQ